MHLVSYLGYLIGSEKNKQSKYVIVSRDTDYDNIIRFWKEYNNASIVHQNHIEASKGVSKQDKNQPTNGEKKSADSKIELNSEIQKALSKVNYTNDIVCCVASLVCKNMEQKNPKQTIYRAIVSKYGQKTGIMYL